MARNKLRRSAAAMANPRGDPLGLIQAIRIRKIPGIQGDSRAQTVIERQVRHCDGAHAASASPELDAPERPKKPQRR
jgi:hypothetical protein